MEGVDQQRRDRAAQAVADELSLGPAELVRPGPRSTYRAGGLALRVGGRSAVELVRRHGAAVASGVSAPAPVDGPFVVGGLGVGVWEWVDGQGPVDQGELGAVLRRLHHATSVAGARNRFAAPPLAKVVHDALMSGREQVRRVGGHPAARALGVLADRVGYLLHPTSDRRVDVVVHGAAHRGNVVAGPGGPWLCDWEMCAVGNRDWDLVPAALEVARFGGDPAEMDRLVAGYQRDPRTDGHFASMVTVREWLATTELARRAVALGDDGLLDEVHTRVGHLAGAQEGRWTRR